MTVNIENNSIAKIIADDEVKRWDKVDAIAALLNTPQGMTDFEEYRRYLQSERIQISTDLITATDTGLIRLSTNLMREAAAPNTAMRDFSKVASVSGEILTRLGKHGESLKDAISRTNDIMENFGSLYLASKDAGHQDTATEIETLISDMAGDIDTLSKLKDNNDDNIITIAATLAAKTADQRDAPKARQQQGLQR